jgi:hypothetical protein
MEKENRNQYGFPTMVCDGCDKLITNDDALVIDKPCQYHGECFENIKKLFPVKIPNDQ